MKKHKKAEIVQYNSIRAKEVEFHSNLNIKLNTINHYMRLLTEEGIISKKQINGKIFNIYKDLYIIPPTNHAHLCHLTCIDTLNEISKTTFSYCGIHHLDEIIQQGKLLITN